MAENQYLVLGETILKLTSEEKQQLSAILGCKPAELEKTWSSYKEAASEEYSRMILGQRVFTRGQDIREYRLFLLIKLIFSNEMPTEQTISNLFQTTTSQSRALLRAVMSKYQYELQGVIDSTLSNVLSGAKQVDGSANWNITVDSENVIEAMNRRLAGIDGTLPQITRSRNMITTYDIDNASYVKLKSAL